MYLTNEVRRLTNIKQNNTTSENNRATKIKNILKRGKEKMTITMKKTKYAKNVSKWIETEQTIEQVSKEYYENTVNAKKLLTILGGHERHKKSYTHMGYTVTNINSISPDKQTKITYDFNMTR